MATRHTKWFASALALALAGVAWAAGDWSAAKSKTDDAKRQIDTVKQQLPKETRKIVTAMCEADDDGRRSAADSAASSARSTINDKYRDAERTTKEALDALDKVRSDDKLKDQHYEASTLHSELESKWSKLEDMSRSLRDGRPQVIEYVLDHAKSARGDRADRCDAKDFRISFDNVDCLMARGDTCQVVALTGDSSRAISKGRDRARHAAAQLDDELKKDKSDILKFLAGKRSDFAKCKHFEARVDCFRLCPDIDDDNRMRDASPSWRQGC